MDELNITLYDEEGKALSYHVEQIFSLEGKDQLYCFAAPAGGGEIVFLKCDLVEKGENTEITFSHIQDQEEYSCVTEAYRTQAVAFAKTELAGQEDIISVMDKEGKERSFIVHLIFTDEATHREYIAVQEISEEGNISENISLYRFFQEDPDVEAVIDMIPSDMEYERAREVFLNLIEKDSLQTS